MVKILRMALEIRRVNALARIPKEHSRAMTPPLPNILHQAGKSPTTPGTLDKPVHWGPRCKHPEASTASVDRRLQTPAILSHPYSHKPQHFSQERRSRVQSIDHGHRVYPLVLMLQDPVPLLGSSTHVTAFSSYSVCRSK